jgi:hypothetical protein
METHEENTYQVKLLTDKSFQGKLIKAGEVVLVRKTSAKSESTVCLVDNPRMIISGSEYKMHFPENDYWRLLFTAD